MQQTLKDIPEIKGRNRREILHELLSKVVFDIQRNPFIQQLLDSDQLKRLTHKLPQAVLEDHFKRDEDTFVSVVQVWQKHGLINHQNPTKVASIRSEEHTSELQSRGHLVCRLLLEKKNKN